MTGERAKSAIRLGRSLFLPRAPIRGRPTLDYRAAEKTAIHDPFSVSFFIDRSTEKRKRKSTCQTCTLVLLKTGAFPIFRSVLLPESLSRCILYLAPSVPFLVSPEFRPFTVTHAPANFIRSYVIFSILIDFQKFVNRF